MSLYKDIGITLLIKKIKSCISDYLTPLALAIWIMNNGASNMLDRPKGLSK